MKLEAKFGTKEALIVIGILVALFFFLVFGITGLRTIIGIFLLFSLPFYLILDYFNLDSDEKIIFSFFLGIGFYSALTYYLGLILKSLRVGMLISFVILMGIGILLFYKKKRKQKTQ